MDRARQPGLQPGRGRSRLGAVAESLQDVALTEPVHVREAGASDVEALTALRFALWPDEPLELRREETEANLARLDGGLAIFVAVDGGEVAGFAEVSLRRDYVNGCETSPVAFLEGVYVRPDQRRGGVGRALIARVEQWGRDQGCHELASDALLANEASHRFHCGTGFEETERVVYFRKPLWR